MPFGRHSMEKLSACFAIIWGAFVVNPTTDVFSRNPGLYRPMLEIYPQEWFWGLLVLIAGLVSFVWSIKGRIPEAALILAITFFGFSCLYFMADVASPAWAIWACLGYFNLTAFWVAKEQWTLSRKNSHPPGKA